ncbi:ANTAR domain-containing protein [Streptomyces tauricus]|uniref:ANTAR domain-containing protein n=1 Tax=Streptomyces tauricus TaxID=68274 RepID=UPI0037F29CE7
MSVARPREGPGPGVVRALEPHTSPRPVRVVRVASWRSVAALGTGDVGYSSRTAGSQLSSCDRCAEAGRSRMADTAAPAFRPPGAPARRFPPSRTARRAPRARAPSREELPGPSRSAAVAVSARRRPDMQRPTASTTVSPNRVKFLPHPHRGAAPEENTQLRQAVRAHAVVDQAIGVVVAMGWLTPEQRWKVLREISQRTNTKLRTVAEHVVTWPRTQDVPLRHRPGTAPPGRDHAHPEPACMTGKELVTQPGRGSEKQPRQSPPGLSRGPLCATPARNRSPRTNGGARRIPCTQPSLTRHRAPVPI